MTLHVDKKAKPEIDRSRKGIIQINLVLLHRLLGLPADVEIARPIVPVTTHLADPPLQLMLRGGKLPVVSEMAEVPVVTCIEHTEENGNSRLEPVGGD